MAAAAAAGADAQLGEYLAQVPLDGPGAYEELGADLRIRQAVPGQPRDECFLLRELIDGMGGALAYGRARGQQFATSPSAKPSIPIAMNISWARVSSLRVLARRFAWRSHSP